MRKLFIWAILLLLSISVTYSSVYDEDIFKVSLGTSDSLPKGVIVMWGGSILSIPDCWQLADGSNGVPDLRDKFIVGAGSSYSISDTGGEVNHTLTIAEMPSHNHTTTVWDNYAGAILIGAGGYTWNSHTITSSNTGGDKAHENRPPYYALAYIQKIC